MKKLFLILTAVFCIGLLQVLPVNADGEQDYFLVTDAEHSLVEYYYYLNGTLHHVPADFSLTDVELIQDEYFIIRGNYYIKNGSPLLIKIDKYAGMEYLSSATHYVIGVDDLESPQKFCISMARQTPAVFTREELAPYLTDQNLKLGDVLLFRNMDISGNDTLYFYHSDEASLPRDIFISGSVLENPVVQNFTLWSKNPKYTRVRTENNWEFDLYLVPEGFETFPAVDISGLRQGAAVPCITWNQKPVALYEIAPNGDADGNQEVDILDIIQINKAILGKEMLPAERIPYIDFNHNHVPDSEDALKILKFIVGLENF